MICIIETRHTFPQHCRHPLDFTFESTLNRNYLDVFVSK